MSFIIRLQNLSRVAKSSDVRAFFSALSIPGGSVCIVGGDSGEAYIGFSTDEDARQAMLRDGLVLCQNRVKLTFSSRKEMEQAMERAQQMSNVVKNVEKVIHPNSMINTPSIQAGQSGLMPSNLSGPNFNQVNNKPPENYGTSWLPSPSKQEPAPAVDNSWKDFLEQALQRIEKAKDSGQPEAPPQQIESKTGTSLLGPPRHFNNQDGRPKFGQQQPSPKPDNFSTFRPPNKPVQQRHEYEQIDPSNGHKFAPNNYRQPNQPRFPDSQKLPPKLSPPSKFPSGNFNQQPKMEPLHQPPSLMPTMDSDYETTLRQQQLAVVEQMAMPPVPQSYDPEELFVEFSRLPPNLTDANSFKQFLLPTAPVEIRMAFNGSIHMCTVCFFANQADANLFVRRDGEAGIKIRWAGRHAFYALPASSQNLNQLNPQIWDASDSQPGKRSLDPTFHGDVKRAKNDYFQNENSWTKPLNSVPSQHESVFYVLLVNVSFKANNWDISKSVEELNVRALNTTHVYSPETERSDKWIVECGSMDEANRLVKNPPFLFGRQSQADLLSGEAAQDIYTNGYQGRWQKQTDKRPNFVPNAGAKSSFPKPNFNTPPAQAKSGGRGGGFFSGSAYGKIRSATLPNPSSPSATRPKSYEYEQPREEKWNDEYDRSSAAGYGRGRDNFRGASRGFKSKPFGSFRPSDSSSRGHFRGNPRRGGFRGRRGGFHRGDDSELAA